MLRLRWLTGIGSPELSDLAGAWTETVSRFEDFGHVHELAWCRAHLAGVLRAAGQLPAAREVADLSRRSAQAPGATPLLEAVRPPGTTPVRAPPRPTPPPPRATERQ